MLVVHGLIFDIFAESSAITGSSTTIRFHGLLRAWLGIARHTPKIPFSSIFGVETGIVGGISVLIATCVLTPSVSVAIEEAIVGQRHLCVGFLNRGFQLGLTVTN